jgi:hypothetical protein
VNGNVAKNGSPSVAATTEGRRELSHTTPADTGAITTPPVKGVLMTCLDWQACPRAASKLLLLL